MRKNITHVDFKNHKKSTVNHKKRIIRVMAVIGSLLMISGVIGSIICYLMA